MGADVADFDPAGGISKGVGSLLQGVSPGGVAVKVGEMSSDTQDGVGPELISAQGCATDHQEEY